MRDSKPTQNVCTRSFASKLESGFGGSNSRPSRARTGEPHFQGLPAQGAATGENYSKQVVRVCVFGGGQESLPRPPCIYTPRGDQETPRIGLLESLERMQEEGEGGRGRRPELNDAAPSPWHSLPPAVASHGPVKATRSRGRSCPHLPARSIADSRAGRNWPQALQATPAGRQRRSTTLERTQEATLGRAEGARRAAFPCICTTVCYTKPRPSASIPPRS